ncbi:MAG: hypothetical protein IPJ40_03165 [Saprospirales bacterium]|nr:hypothetical protein [Saprospirales bacterium]
MSEELIGNLSGITELSYIDVKDGNSVTSRIKTYSLEELKIGEVSFFDVGFAKIGFTESAWFKCLGLDGTIGPNVMKECYWLFDNEEKRLTFTNDKTSLPIIRNGVKVPLYTDQVF